MSWVLPRKEGFKLILIARNKVRRQVQDFVVRSDIGPSVCASSIPVLLISVSFESVPLGFEKDLNRSKRRL